MRLELESAGCGVHTLPLRGMEQEEQEKEEGGGCRGRAHACWGQVCVGKATVATIQERGGQLERRSGGETAGNQQRMGGGDGAEAWASACRRGGAEGPRRGDWLGWRVDSELVLHLLRLRISWDI